MKAHSPAAEAAVAELGIRVTLCVRQQGLADHHQPHGRIECGRVVRVGGDDPIDPQGAGGNDHVRVHHVSGTARGENRSRYYRVIPTVPFG